ncbi:GTPase domain-containing protein [Candidatus Harpocratesius sp.]
MPQYYSIPKYVTIDLFGKVGVGKTTIFNLFAGDRLLKDGGNLSYDYRIYYARCWILQRRWEHSMVFLTDPKLDMRWKDLRVRHLQRLFEPTNVLMIVTDSTKEDVMAVKQSFSMYPKIKRKLIIFIIANQQDLPGRLNLEEIKETLQMEDIIAISAIDPSCKVTIEKFMEKAVLRYFTMLAKRGEALMLLDEDEIGFGAKLKKKKQVQGKFSHRIKKIKQKLDQKTIRK